MYTVSPSNHSMNILIQQEMDGYATVNWSKLPCTNPQHVDLTCRETMAQWALRVGKVFNCNHETIETCLSYMDRYVAAEGHDDRTEYQLTSMTALYTAIKIHESTCMNPNTLSFFARGSFSKKDIFKHEKKMLQVLRWRMNPPTTMAIVREMIQQLHVGDDNRVTELTEIQAEHAISQSSLLGISKCTIALAALWNTLRSLSLTHATSISKLVHAVGIEKNFDIAEVERICATLAPSLKCRVQASRILPDHQSHSEGKQSEFEASPKSVARVAST